MSELNDHWHEAGRFDEWLRLDCLRLRRSGSPQHPSPADALRTPPPMRSAKLAPTYLMWSPERRWYSDVTVSY